MEQMSHPRPLMKVSVTDVPPLVRVHHDDSGSIRITGTLATLISIMGDKLGFDVQPIVPPDGIHCGSQYPNGSWKGMIGMVERKEVDVGLGPCTVNTRWSNVLEYTMPVDTQSSDLFMKRPEPEHNISSFLKPFTYEVWSLILISFCCISVTMGFLIWAEGKITGHQSKRIISKAVIWALQAISQEGSEWLPRLQGGRVLVATWLLATLVFMSSFAGVLTAMLTVPSFHIPIDSVSDLVAQSEVPWRLEVGSFIYQLFRDSESEVFRKVFEGSQPMDGNCWTNKEAISQGEYVTVCIRVIAWSAMALDFSKTGKCHFYLGKHPVYKMNQGVMVLKRNSEYQEPFNNIILRLHEAGLFDKWLVDEVNNVTQCLLPPGSDLRDGNPPALSISALLGPITFLGTGLATGILVFVLEMLVHQATHELYRNQETQLTNN